ncbi:MAG TPA: GntR family transcriptional regulator [Ardenticatenaceae bacterium]|nr:GntR family transcriptional regulator [Ardenticatenaceae bacterium]
MTVPVVDKSSPIPLYYQIAEWIRELIKSGRLKPGDQLPSERELVDQSEVSRMTVRQALAYLIREGLLVARPGIGTFVADPKLAHTVLHLLGFTEEMMRRGGMVSSRVLEQTVVVPPTGVATALRLRPGEQAVKIVRLRRVAGTPMLLETIYVPAALSPGLEHEDLDTGSLYALLEQHYGLSLNHAQETLEATTANEYEGDLFGIPPGTAMILVEGTTYLRGGQPVEYFKAVYRGDRFKFQFESQRNGVTEVAGASNVSVVLV